MLLVPAISFFKMKSAVRSTIASNESILRRSTPFQALHSCQTKDPCVHHNRAAPPTCASLNQSIIASFQMQADNIAVLQGGAVAEQGKFSELMAKPDSLLGNLMEGLGGNH